MQKFISDDKLNVEILEIISNAKEELVIVSPYIKLSKKMKFELDKLRDVPIEITILFGKNDSNLSKSLSREDIEYFTNFQNISILYNERLHAKYYSNETKAIICSMNLHEYSQSNNFEAGIAFDLETIWDSGSLFKDAIDYFDSILDDPNTQILFDKEPKSEKKLWGLVVQYQEDEFIVHQNNIEAFYNSGSGVSLQVGYCIRTGREIPFNPSRPFSRNAYKRWNEYKNPDYPEKYCHKTGKDSKGKTSMRNPILFT